MTLFCVRDGDAANDSKGWNQPLKKIERPNPLTPKQQYIPTSTPGVVIDSQTAKMETQIPENEFLSAPVGKQYVQSAPVNNLPDPKKSSLPIICYTGDRLDWLNNVFDAEEKIARGQIVRFDRWIIKVKGEVIEAVRIFTSDVPHEVLDRFSSELVHTRVYRYETDLYFIDMSDTWFYVKNFPAFRHSFAEI